MTTDKIQFTKEKETMLMMLSSKALQSQWKRPILRDPWAVEAMRHIDYDMSQTLTGVSAWSMFRENACPPGTARVQQPCLGGKPRGRDEGSIAKLCQLKNSLRRSWERGDGTCCQIERPGHTIVDSDPDRTAGIT